MTIRQILLMILDIISAFIGVVMGGRIIFLLVGANQASPITIWINNASNFFIAPFRGLFQTITINSNSVIDVTAIVALLVYAVAFSFIYRFILYLTHPSDVTEVREVRQTHSSV